MQSVILRRSCSGGAACRLAPAVEATKSKGAPPSSHSTRSSSIGAPRTHCGSTSIISMIRRPLQLAPVRAAANEEAAAAEAPSAAAPAPAAPTAADNDQLAAERRRGVKTVLGELRGLDMPPSEVLRYARGAVKLPKRAPVAADGVPVSRAAEALAELMMADSGAGAAAAALPTSGNAACNDPRALAALNHLLTDLWRWKRRGGGSRWDEDDQATSPSAVALLELQGVDVGGRAAAAAEAAAREGGKGGGGGGGFFDAGNLDEREKQELAGMMRGAAMAGVQNAFWGSLVLSAIVLLLLNFARG